MKKGMLRRSYGLTLSAVVVAVLLLATLLLAGSVVSAGGRQNTDLSDGRMAIRASEGSVISQLARRPAAVVPDSSEDGTAAPTAATHPPSVNPLRPSRRPQSADSPCPVMFIENVGQFDKRARFQVRGSAGTMWLTENALWITLLEKPDTEIRGQGDKEPISPSPKRGVNLKLTFPGANPHPRLEPFDRLDTKVSYFLGDDPGQWHPNVPVWAGVRYEDLYPGIDLEVTSQHGRWAWQLDFGNLQYPISGIRLRVAGAEGLALDGDVLSVATAIGDFTLPLLMVENGKVEGSNVERANVQRVNTQTFDVTSPFTLTDLAAAGAQRLVAVFQDNPDDLLYSTFLGGSDRDAGWAITVDRAGSAYVTGHTKSSDFPTTAGAFDTSYNGDDAFVVKFNTGGTTLEYVTFLGGTGDECFWRCAIAIDEDASVYVTGSTESSDFPTTAGTSDTSYNGGGDAFVVKLNPDGTDLEYATFLGGGDWDEGWAITVDNNAYVTGETRSSDFPTTAEAFDASYNGGGDAFVAKLNPNGTGLAYATFLGGSGWEWGDGIAMDEMGSLYVTGETRSSDFPTTAEAFDTSRGGSVDAFVVRLDASSTRLSYATFLGGSNVDGGDSIAVDGTGSAYVRGNTNSSDFPTTAGAFDTSYNGGGDAFVVKLNPDGTGLAYATFLGGSAGEWSEGFAIDSTGSAYVMGDTRSSDFPTTPEAFDTSYGGGTCGTGPLASPCPDAFIVKLNFDGTALAYATFLGGSGAERGFGIAVGEEGSAYATGWTESSDFPTTPGAFDTSRNGDYDAFVAKLAVGGEGETTPGEVELVGQFRGRVNAVAVQGDYAYIGADLRLVALDVSDPANPVVVGQTAPLPDSLRDVEVAGHYAYVAAGEAGLRIIDISNPVHPVEVGFYRVDYYTFSVAVAENYAYLVGSYGYPKDLLIVDISDPAHPVEVGFSNTSLDLPSDVAVVENYAYVVGCLGVRCGGGSLKVIDVSNPTAPTRVSEFWLPDWAYGVTVVESHAYVAIACCGFAPAPGPIEPQSGLRIINVSEPTNPIEVGFWLAPITDSPSDVAVMRNYAYMADGEAGLRVIDVSDPTHPYEVGYYNTPGYSHDVFVSGYYIYMADGDGGLLILRFAGAEPTYSISGRVTQADGDHLSGVTISDDVGHAATTDSGGNYMLSELPAGTYTVTPFKEGYAFSPASRTVTVPPDATGVNFTGVGQRVKLGYKQAFDTCEAPTISEMQTWRDYSPYRGVGIYIGGSSRTCNKQLNLSPEWIVQVAGQGWHFLPLWVGPQAPCSEFRYRFNDNPTQAREQGKQEARQAIAAARNLGFADQSTGTIIYYNMESYNTRNQECRNAVKSFVAGWVSELHAHGYKAGVYGAGCGSAAADWATFSPGPDTVWLAAWYREEYDPNASVYGVSCVPDTIWNNHQRIRQYAGNDKDTEFGHWETWGDKRMFIDSNIEDGLVAAVGDTNARAGGYDAMSSPPVYLSQPEIRDMDLLTPDEGWILSGQRLLWTTNGGAEWIDISPPITTNTVIKSVFFSDTSNGWAMSSRDAQLTLWHTTDGRLWEDIPFPASESDDVSSTGGAIYLHFIDSQTGWGVIKLPSSSNFSVGRLLKTSDGGATWTELKIPIGEPVRFITPDIGWVAGGPGGDQLYVTRDGGNTWEPQGIVAQENITGYLIYDLPAFENAQDGIVPVTINDLTQTRVEFYVTHDGGQSWTLTTTVPISQQVTPYRRLPMEIIDSTHWVIADPNTIPNLPPNVGALDFVAPDIGWAYTGNGICTQSQCSLQMALSRTADGGETWTQVEVPYLKVYLPLILRNR